MSGSDLLLFLLALGLVGVTVACAKLPLRREGRRRPRGDREDRR
ncbi:hypothetical protein [Nocardia nova]|nr:hypothetical protein [Nocardia nova]